MRLLEICEERKGWFWSLGVVLIIVDFWVVGNHDDESNNYDQAQDEPHFDRLRAWIENIVSHCSVDNKGQNNEARQDGEFFQSVNPRLKAFWEFKSWQG